MWNYNANLSINLVVKQDAFSNIFFPYLLRCSLVYYTQPPSETIHFHCVCEQLCPWQDCADVQARLSLRWPHVREVTSHELTRFVKHDAEACKINLHLSLCVCAYV